MNFLEALIELRHGKRNVWIRPRSWKGMKGAFTQDKDGTQGKFLVFVPRANGAYGDHPTYFPSISDLMSDWEAVTPLEVNTGS
jgi:hypothetical protein